MGKALYLNCMICKGPVKEKDWVFCENCKSGPPIITIPEDADLDKIKEAMESYQADGNSVPVITSPYPCCPFCVVFDKLPGPIRDKILALMRIANQ